MKSPESEGSHNVKKLLIEMSSTFFGKFCENFFKMTLLRSLLLHALHAIYFMCHS